MLIDTHAHLDSNSFPMEELESVIERAVNAGVRFVINPGTDVASSIQARDIADKYSNIFFAAGIHCHEAKTFTDEGFAEIERLLSHPKALAVGEIGLDYHYDFSPREQQKSVLVKFLDLAVSLEKPVILHCREAEEDLHEILQGYKGKSTGVIHCYSGTAAWVQKFLDLGYYIGFTGVVTFKNSNSVRESVSAVPTDRLLSETDAPYMAPVPYRGKRNEPAYIPLIVEKLAEIKGTDRNTLISVLLQNASDCFKYRFA